MLLVIYVAQSSSRLACQMADKLVVNGNKVAPPDFLFEYLVEQGEMRFEYIPLKEVFLFWEGPVWEVPRTKLVSLLVPSLVRFLC
jgi:hypothetical protein